MRTVDKVRAGVNGGTAKLCLAFRDLVASLKTQCMRAMTRSTSSRSRRALTPATTSASVAIQRALYRPIVIPSLLDKYSSVGSRPGDACGIQRVFGVLYAGVPEVRGYGCLRASQSPPRLP
jgi:hypothetical protein